MDADAGCQMHGRKHREPASDILFVESEGLARKPDEWVEDGAPSDLVFVDGVVEMACADGVFGQDQRAVVRVPDGESPVADEFGKTIGTPQAR